jgi:hypothetical protein
MGVVIRYLWVAMVNARPGEGPISPLGARTPLPATHLPGTEHNKSPKFSQSKHLI